MDIMEELKYVHAHAHEFWKLCEERSAWSRLDKIVFSNNLRYIRERINEITDINQLFSDNNKQLLDSICVVACKVKRSRGRMEDHEEDRLRHEKFIVALCDAYDEYHDLQKYPVTEADIQDQRDFLAGRSLLVK